MYPNRPTGASRKKQVNPQPAIVAAAANVAGGRRMSQTTMADAHTPSSAMSTTRPVGPSDAIRTPGHSLRAGVETSPFPVGNSST